MADPITLTIAIISILSSAATFSVRTNDIVKRAKRSDTELETQIYEIKVTCEVLEECHGIIQASQNTKIPPSVERALDICQRRYRELMVIMERVRHLKLQSDSALEKLRKGTKLMVTENARKAAFTAFRDAVLLLRDLCTDIRLQQQLVNMSASLAELLVNHYDESASHEEPAPQPAHIHIDGEDEHFVKGKLTHTLSSDMDKRWPKTKGNFPGRTWKDLITQNFTRNATIVLDSGVGLLPERVRYIHVRAKMDTGCNDNLITMDLIDRAHVDRSLLVEIPEDDQFELTMIEGAKSTPAYKLPLTWYQDGDSKMRHSDFYVVKDGPFDMLIGSHRFAQDFDSNSHPGLVVGKKGKKKAELNKARAEHAKHLEEQEKQEKAERDAQRAQAALQALPSRAGHIQPPAASSPAPPVTNALPGHHQPQHQVTRRHSWAPAQHSGQTTSSASQSPLQTAANVHQQSSATGGRLQQPCTSPLTAPPGGPRRPAPVHQPQATSSTPTRHSAVHLSHQKAAIPLSNLPAITSPSRSTTQPASAISLTASRSQATSAAVTSPPAIAQSGQQSPPSTSPQPHTQQKP